MEIAPETVKVEVPHPVTGEGIGMWFYLRHPHHKKVQAAEKRLVDWYLSEAIKNPKVPTTAWGRAVKRLAYARFTPSFIQDFICSRILPRVRQAGGPRLSQRPDNLDITIAYVDGWEFGEETTIAGEKPEFSEENLRKVLADPEMEWIRCYLDAEITERCCFFEPTGGRR